ncbi:gamma carbonic anhydrase family protein [Dehalobacter sp. DCM]|uniref:gamma carbonic anhydrase family protein n=1 Tax=Dehalobacter sp. DCM TaxID=2907827 RepID=UPI00308209EC|nr:gamma carbonic anhydrase family protein [Dehalobacter sp. DCM]
MIFDYLGKSPVLGKDVYLAEGAKVIGDVTIGSQSSIWFNSVLRGDIAPIMIGKNVNIQDLSMIHVNTNLPTLIEDNVSVGHGCILHSCTIHSGSLIGMGTIILNESEIGMNCLVAAGSLIPERKKYPPHTLIMGSPAKVVRELTPEEIAANQRLCESYIRRSWEYLNRVSTI